MANQELHNDPLDLISKYLSGNATEAEMVALENWVLANPENKEQFMAFKKAWMLSGAQQTPVVADVNKNWDEITTTLFPETPVVELQPRSNQRRWLSIAATVAVLAVAAIWSWQFMTTQSDMVVQAEETTKEIQLPDGSEITLNQSSSIRYPSKEDPTKRAVELKGDAFFDVQREEKRPFVISTDHVEIEVLGTSFYVDARSKVEETQVIVASGSVAVRTTKDSLVLIAGEKAIYNKVSGALTKADTTDKNYLFLKNNTLVFDQTRFSEVAFVLNRKFNVNISFASERLKDCEYTTTFTDKSLDAILTIWESSFGGLQIQRNGNEIILTGEKCD